MKQCTKCKETKPLNEFYNSKNNKDGKTYNCKVCQDAVYNKYRIEQREKINAYQRQYQQNNPERVRKYAKNYRDNNKESYNKKINEWRKDNIKQYVGIQLNYQSKIPAGIYAIKYKGTIVYVGSSTMPLRRVNTHLSTIKSATNLTAINKLFSYCGYNKEDFEYEIIEECKADDLLKREKHYEEEYNAKHNYTDIFRDVPSITQIMKDEGTYHFVNRKKSRDNSK